MARSRSRLPPMRRPKGRGNYGFHRAKYHAAPVDAGFVILENGDALITEDNNPIITET